MSLIKIKKVAAYDELIFPGYEVVNRKNGKKAIVTSIGIGGSLATGIQYADGTRAVVEHTDDLKLLRRNPDKVDYPKVDFSALDSAELMGAMDAAAQVAMVNFYTPQGSSRVYEIKFPIGTSEGAIIALAKQQVGRLGEVESVRYTPVLSVNDSKVQSCLKMIETGLASYWLCILDSYKAIDRTGPRTPCGPADRREAESVIRNNPVVSFKVMDRGDTLMSAETRSKVIKA